ncbi:meiotic cell cortex C-terminal pleckstrin homology-domain-containing protein [Infundibulicybe gibba]|nr:meiotic cell cortex C-terminal pleckstrin homology-domain-containing protein [Infundibulicybe gibba]
MASAPDGGSVPHMPGSFSTSNDPSPSAGDMKLHLRHLLDSKEKQLQQAGTFGQRVLAQQMELEERIRQLQELEADKSGEGDIDAEARERYRALADTVIAWDSENAQLLNTFGDSKRLANDGAPPPISEESDRSGVSAKTSAAQSRRAKNAAHRADDVEFAFEIGSGLLTEVRRLQSLLGERDKAIEDMKEEKDDLERSVESLRAALRQQEQSADKFKEENWNLEVTLQELRAQLGDPQPPTQRLESEHKRLTRLLAASRDAGDQYKNESERLQTIVEEIKNKHEIDITQARKHAAELARDKSDLQQTVDTLKAEAKKVPSPEFVAPLVTAEMSIQSDPVPIPEPAVVIVDSVVETNTPILVEKTEISVQTEEPPKAEPVIRRKGNFSLRQHGSSMPPSQRGLRQFPSTSSFRSAANAATYAQHSAKNQSRPATPATDPAIIHKIAQITTGEFLYKDTRGTAGIGHGERECERFFWVRPYTKTLYWSSADPGSSTVLESSVKSAHIEGVRSVLDPSPVPSGSYQYSVVVSIQREMKITAPTKERHDIWLNALEYLLSWPSGMNVTSPANSLAVPPSPVSGEYMDDRQPPRTASPQSQRNGRSAQRGDMWNTTSQEQGSRSQSSTRGTIDKRSGTPVVGITAQDDEDLNFELHSDSFSDGECPIDDNVSIQPTDDPYTGMSSRNSRLTGPHAHIHGIFCRSSASINNAAHRYTTREGGVYL